MRSDRVVSAMSVCVRALGKAVVRRQWTQDVDPCRVRSGTARRAIDRPPAGISAEC